MAGLVGHDWKLSLWQIEILCCRVLSLVKAFEDDKLLGALELLEKLGDKRVNGIS